MASPYDTDFRLDKRVTLSAAAVYLPSFSGANDMGNFEAGEEFLDKYNLGLKVWPGGGFKQPINTFNHLDYEKPIPNTKAAYQKLRKDVDSFLRNRAPSFPLLVPIIFCQFHASGVAVTPHSTKSSNASPACLISMGAASVKDKMTIIHEMGHAALYPKHEHNQNAGNLMFEAEPRTYMFRYQAEAFASSMFARA